MSTSLPAVLPGPGSTDYARYMRTDVLLSLQRGTAERAHPDELLFQVVHQCAELWFKLIHHELGRALDHLAADQPSAAEQLVQRAVRCLALVTEQLHMLRHLHPAQFAAFRQELGTGSGFESPGWKGLREITTELDIAFSRLLSSLGVTPIDVYRGGQSSDPLFRLAEALVSLDEQIALWRTEHYTVATRIIGQGVLGTRNTPIDSLTRLITHRRFPTLWEARTDLTEASPRGRQSRQAPR